MPTRLKNFVTQVPTDPPDLALEHFSNKLKHETDCWDVHSTRDFEDRGFVLVDVRSREAFDAGHVPGAIHIPQAQLTEARLADYPADTLFVVYCAGTHCNGSTRAAMRLARLGRPVKEMIGGALGWVDEGFHLVAAES
ncbi:MAG: rhodanese-like domain-containing protein [Planctomycetota bacterium]